MSQDGTPTPEPASSSRFEEYRFFTIKWTLDEYDLILYALHDVGTEAALALAEKLRRHALPSMALVSTEDLNGRDDNQWTR